MFDQLAPPLIPYTQAPDQLTSPLNPYTHMLIGFAALGVEVNSIGTSSLNLKIGVN